MARIELPPPVASFSSDNAAGVHPGILEALAGANEGSAVAYGDDPWTARAVDTFRDLFGAPVEVAMCWGGTGANVVALQSLLRPWQAVICTDAAHIAVDECGAPERFCGAKLIDVPSPDGKLTPDGIRAHTHLLGDLHHVQPAVVSITQSTESGTLYAPDEVAALADEAHRHGMALHVDGARIANATAALAGDGAGHDAVVAALRATTVDAGVDVLTFGGTKAGMMYGEAVVYLQPELGADVRFVRKQAAQLPSKMRFVAAQFEALLADDLWVRLAGDSHRLARRLHDEAGALDGVTIERPPVVNSVFAVLPRPAIDALQQWSFFWDWDPRRDEVRWMTSWATTDEDVDRFVAGIRTALA